MRPDGDGSVIEIWRHAFILLGSLELGKPLAWAGPDDLEELKLRVETLALLLALVPGSHVDRLEDVAAHLSASYPIGAPVDLGAMRFGIRRLLNAAVDPATAADRYLQRAVQAVSRGHCDSVQPSQAVAVEPGASEQDHTACREGMRRWFQQLAEGRQWAYLKLAFSDEREIPIDQVFVEVFAVPDEHIEASADPGADPVRRVKGRMTKETHAAIDAESMVSRIGRFCVVIGEPGSGKSTLVKWIARSVAEQRIADYEAPVVVSLGAFSLELAKSPSRSILEYFFDTVGINAGECVGAANWLRGAAREGVNYLLLLDGWDEVPPARRERVQERIEQEARLFTTIVTSRPSGFPRRLAIGRRAEVYHLAGLSQEGRDTLASRYLAALSRESLLSDLLKQVEANHDLRELAGNPFMLALLTRSFAQSGVDAVTEWTPCELYQRAAQWIVDVAAERGGLMAQSLAGLGRLSFGLLLDESAPRYLFSAMELGSKLDGEQAEAVVASRFVSQVDRDAQNLAFLHATFQEYFAARHFESLVEPELAHCLERAFLSASRLVILEFVVGLASAAGKAGRALLDRWMETRDRYGQVLYRLGRLLAACPTGERRPDLMMKLRSELWMRINGTSDLDVKQVGVSIFARLDPVALCRAAAADKSPDQFVLDCITSTVPAEIGRAERITELLDPAMRERVEAELWGGLSRETMEENRRTLSQAPSSDPALRKAILDTGAARDLGAVSALEARLRCGDLPDEAQEEIATSLGLIGGNEATRVLVDLVAGKIAASRVAVGLARRSLQHVEGGRSRLNPAGRDLLLRRIACAPADRPTQIVMLSALKGFPIRSGTKLLKHLARSVTAPRFVRLECLEALETSLPDDELDVLIGGIQAEHGEIEALLLSFAVARRRPIPFQWLATRLQGAGRLPDKTMLLTVALAMSARHDGNSREVIGLLEKSMRRALSDTEQDRADLARALQSAVSDVPVDHARPPVWIDAALCERTLKRFVARDQRIAADQVMCAATLMGRIPARDSGTRLRESLANCQERLGQPLEQMQAKLLLEVAGVVAQALAELDPVALLTFPADWQPVRDV
ncbi:MAG: NACHT domain-containing protein, partial [Tepidisphaeraceae bacterium]